MSHKKTREKLGLRHQNCCLSAQVEEEHVCEGWGREEKTGAHVGEGKEGADEEGKEGSRKGEKKVKK
jgi:hypothetical protein